MFTLFVGRNHTPHVVSDRGCRTQAQFEAVEKLLPKIDFACNNPFEAEFPGQKFYSTFRFLFYRKDINEVRLAKITPTGRVSFLNAAEKTYVKNMV